MLHGLRLDLLIGLGNMGQPMAANILKAGYPLAIYDIRRDRGESLEAVGEHGVRSACG